MIDVEGWEQHVLEGSRGLLTLDPKPLWIVEILPDPKARRTEPTQAFSIMFEHGVPRVQNCSRRRSCQSL